MENGVPSTVKHTFWRSTSKWDDWQCWIKKNLKIVYLICYKPLLLLQRISILKRPSYTTNVFLCLVSSVGVLLLEVFLVVIGLKHTCHLSLWQKKKICWYWKDEIDPLPRLFLNLLLYFRLHQLLRLMPSSIPVHFSAVSFILDFLFSLCLHKCNVCMTL